MEISACFKISEAVGPSSGYKATPKLAVNKNSLSSMKKTSVSSLLISFKYSKISSLDKSRWIIIANSSPSVRPNKSSLWIFSLILSAIFLSNKSPTRCPAVSLTAVKLSMSKKY